VAEPGLAIVDDDGAEVVLDADEAARLFALTSDLDAATVSACPECRSRVLAVVALVDLLGDAPPHNRAGELVQLADDAPTLHVFVRDLSVRCGHRTWRDPGFEEWSDVMADVGDRRTTR
jgi:hypothetical protein